MMGKYVNVPSNNELDAVSLTGKEPLVTVVVPAYNHEDYVPGCIKSILDQDYPAIELIVINDGSTDDTDARVRELIEGDNLDFKYISKGNEGLIKTLNLGLRQASGKYFCELASDDMLLPGSIAKRVEYLEANPVLDAVFADGYVMEDSRKTEKRAFEGNSGFDSERHTIEDLLDLRAKIFFATGMIRKEVLDGLGGFDEDFRYYEDAFTEYQLVMRGKVGYLDEPVMYYRVHSSNVSKTFHLETRREKLLALEKLYGLAGSDSLKRVVKGYIYKERWKYFKFGRKSGMPSGEISKLLEECMKIRPWSLKLMYYRVFFALSKAGKTGHDGVGGKS